MLFHRSVHATDNELSAYLDGRLADRVRERVSGHLSGCAICQRALDGLRMVRASLQGMPRARAPRSFALREADARPALRVAGRARAMPLLSGVTAISLLAFLVLVGFDVSNGGLEMSWSASPSSSSAGRAAPQAGIALTSPGAEQATIAAFTGAEGKALSISTPAPAGTASLGAANNDRAAAGAATSVSTPALTSAPTSSSGNDMSTHIAEVTLAAVALVSGAGAVVVSRRRAG